jgi:hypothetical protein
LYVVGVDFPGFRYVDRDDGGDQEIAGACQTRSVVAQLWRGARQGPASGPKIIHESLTKALLVVISQIVIDGGSD